MAATVFFALLVLPTILAAALDQRLVRDLNPWIKPLKFQVAVALYLGTLAWFSRWVPHHVRALAWWRPFLFVTILSAAYEIFWIMGSSMFGIESHFNVQTPFMSVAYSLAGFFAIVLTSASLVIGLLLFRNPPPLKPALQIGVPLGLVLTFLGTVIVAGYLGSAGSHYVGGQVSDATGIAVLGWSTSLGDLRVPHFLATHAMHVVPIAALAVAFLLPASVQCHAVWFAGFIYALVIAGAFIQALMGLPFNHFVR